MIPIVPAFIPQTKDAVRETLNRLAFSTEVHLDVVDGVFVPATSWPYQPVGSPCDVKSYTDQFTLEVDLMTADPLPAAVDWVTAGADMLVFHAETISLENFKNFEAYTHVTVGVAIHGDTPIDILHEYAQFADYIQLMGIHSIGAQGQTFDPTVLDRIQQMKAAFPNKVISVDGSVNARTITQLKEAGADRLIVGSAITLQSEPFGAYTELGKLINQ